jgi:hypothetical protein
MVDKTMFEAALKIQEDIFDKNCDSYFIKITDITPLFSLSTYGISEKYMLMVLSLITLSLYVSPVCAQVSTNGTKTWLDREHNIKILFNTTPAQPTIDTPSVLRFTVQNLKTDKPVTKLLATVVILGGNINQETPFRSANISAPYGEFSINIIFPNMGSYQVITRITSQTHDVASLASFTVIVPAPQSTLNFFGGNYIIWVSLLIAAAAGILSFLILKNTMYKD